MLRRHSGPSIAAATLAVLASLTMEVSAQETVPATPPTQVQPTLPSANPAPAPSVAVPAPTATSETTSRVTAPPAAAVPASPAVSASPVAPQAPAAPAPATTAQAPVVVDTPAAPSQVAPAAPQPMPAAPEAAAPAQAPAAATPVAPSATAETPAPAAPATPATAEAPVATESPTAPVADQTEQPMPPEGSLESFLPDIIGVPDSTLPHNLSPIGMFMAADWVVKGVMISLAFASLVTWTIGIVKTLQLAGAKVRSSTGLKAISNARTLDGALKILQHRGGTVAGMVRVANHEVRLSDAAIEHAGGEGVKERVASALHRIEVLSGRNISKGTGVLATIGSTAPFVGLFGTVWGIMNSFIGISESQTTNLAVVAPGIAEALLATAIGLVAAIPAVIIYNVFARSVTGYRQGLADAAAAIERLVSRDLDFRKIPVEARNTKIKLVTE